ncbi:MAG: heat-inducible transcription repressor HrcA [Clostridia bacterium]|nr:heat-inducible transcription repressor HrcA [Clostridia bacterium]
MDPRELSERKKLILKAVIEAHIETGEPVGSKYLMQYKQIAYSSATIRNEMADLEEMGFLEQPHTSAGRVPSEIGYRFYVDSLIEKYNMTTREITELKTALRSRQSELDNILEEAMRLASSMTNYTALALRPRNVRNVVTRYEVIRLEERRLVLVMVMSGGVVKSKYILCEAPIPEEAAALLARTLNECLISVTAEEITLPLLVEMERRMGIYAYLVNPVSKGIYETLTSFGGGELKFEGVNRLLSYPDYDIDRLKQMLAMIEQKEELLQLISEETTALAQSGDDNKVQVYIGHENLVKIMDNSTLILKTVRSGGHVVGTIGIIGPTRMDYSRVISMIDQLSSGIRDALGDDTGPGTGFYPQNDTEENT